MKKLIKNKMIENIESQVQENENSTTPEVQQEALTSNPDTDKLYARAKTAEEGLKSMKNQLAEMNKREKEREDTKLAEAGDYKELLSAKQKELDEFTIKADRVDSLNSVVQTLYEKELANISEEKRGMIPYQDDPVKALEYIAQWRDQLTDTSKVTISPSTPRSTTNPGDETEIARSKMQAYKERINAGNLISDSERAEYVRLVEQVGRN
jgi:hypothetical protein